MQETKPAAGRERRLTTANVNAWFAAALADPALRAALRQDWVKALLSDLAATPAERAGLTSLPAGDARALQAAMAKVADRGGTVHLDRPSETGPGKLTMRPGGGEHADFSIGIFHCTFDANFQHWHCGWGPG